MMDDQAQRDMLALIKQAFEALQKLAEILPEDENVRPLIMRCIENLEDALAIWEMEDR